MRDAPSALRSHWHLDDAVTFLNHGSFGACPKPVLAYQDELRLRMEREPVQFFVMELEGLQNQAREAVAKFVGARPEDLGFVRNATAGFNAILRCLPFEAGDELLTTDHAYNACRNTIDYVASRTGATVVTAHVPFPLASPDEATEALLQAASDRTRLAIVDHITSSTGLVLPIADIVKRLRERGIETLVDGAHAPGMVDLSIESLGAGYYTANFHKWVCAPKGAAMLWVRPDLQEGFHPAAISHGYNSPRPRKKFLEEIDWVGTDDPSPALAVPKAIEFIGSLLPGGWDEIRTRNRTLALAGRRILATALDVDVPAPESMIGTLAALPLPDGGDPVLTTALYSDPIQRALFRKHRIEVPVPPWPAPPKRLIRISAHLYNTREDYERLATALPPLLG
ncbi:MAG: aminotransferase class V-fold PLP-dependent enzyme [Myxococcota bacterium]